MGTKECITWACKHIRRDRQSWAGCKQTSPPLSLVFFFSFSFFLLLSMIFTGIETKQRKRTTFKRRKHHFTNKEIPHWYSASARDWHTPSHTPSLSLSSLNLHLPFDHPLPSASTTRIFHIRSLLGRFVAVDHIQLRRWQQFCPQLFIVFDCVFFSFTRVTCVNLDYYRLRQHISTKSLSLQE